jgi:hypothetical protein
MGERLPFGETDTAAVVLAQLDPGPTGLSSAAGTLRNATQERRGCTRFPQVAFPPALIAAKSNSPWVRKLMLLKLEPLSLPFIS